MAARDVSDIDGGKSVNQVECDLAKTSQARILDAVFAVDLSDEQLAVSTQRNLLGTECFVTRSGWLSANSSARCPPADPPTIAACLMPFASINATI